MFQSSSFKSSKRKRSYALDSAGRLEVGKGHTYDRVAVLPSALVAAAIASRQQHENQCVHSSSSQHLIDGTVSVSSTCTLDLPVAIIEKKKRKKVKTDCNFRMTNPCLRFQSSYNDRNISLPTIHNNNNYHNDKRRQRLRSHWFPNCYSLALLLSLIMSHHRGSFAHMNNNIRIPSWRNLQTLTNSTGTSSPTGINRPSPSPSLQQTMEPISQPSSHPSSLSSAQPSLPPTYNPTAKPTISTKPSSRPSIANTAPPSVQPSYVPTIKHSKGPSTLPSFFPTFNPSAIPSKLPSLVPSTSNYPSLPPSTSPTKSMVPSSTPSLSHQPSTIPTFQPSLTPTDFPSTTPSQPPSTQPSISSSPSQSPSLSSQPSSQPTEQPSSEPTNAKLSQLDVFLYQELIGIPQKLNTTQEDDFESIIESYKVNITNGTLLERVEMVCNVDEKSSQPIPQIPKLNLQYKVSFKSRHTKVESYGNRLKLYLNDNLNQMVQQLNDVGIPVSTSSQVFDLGDVTNPPTVTPTRHPSAPPTMVPTYPPSSIPSMEPSQHPSLRPSSKPSMRPSSSPTLAHSSSPSLFISEYPSSVPSGSPSSSPTINISSSTTIIVTVTVAVSGMAMILLAGLCLRKKYFKPHSHDEGLIHVIGNNGNGNHHTSNRLSQERPSRTNGILGGGIRATSLFRGTNTFRNQNLEIDVLPSEDSLISPRSNISTGSSVNGGGSVNEEYDGTQVLADEFEKYKDRNLEKMRADLEGNGSDFNDMMSQALTMALMDDDDEDGHESDMLTGLEKNSSQIEVDLLWDMHDWVKKAQANGFDDNDKSEFMQKSLNKMVSNVRHGFVSPEDAIRTIHICAALLGLKLEKDIPETTLIITGMRKSVSRQDVHRAFEVFGEIESAAVSSNRRGFGVVRFISKKYAYLAYEHFQTSEIVVQDVAVSVLLLRANTSQNQEIAR